MIPQQIFQCGLGWIIRKIAPVDLWSTNIYIKQEKSILTESKPIKALGRNINQLLTFLLKVLQIKDTFHLKSVKKHWWQIANRVANYHLDLRLPKINLLQKGSEPHGIPFKKRSSNPYFQDIFKQKSSKIGEEIPKKTPTGITNYRLDLHIKKSIQERDGSSRIALNKRPKTPPSNICISILQNSQKGKPSMRRRKKRNQTQREKEIQRKEDPRAPLWLACGDIYSWIAERSTACE